MVIVKDVEYGGFKTDVQVDEAVYKKIREDVFAELAPLLTDTVIMDDACGINNPEWCEKHCNSEFDQYCLAMYVEQLKETKQ